MADRQDGISASDIQTSYAWGQLFVGSILSGFSIWKLCEKALDLPLSDTLAGWSAAYEQVRDFMMLPFSWFHFDLSVNEKSILTLCVVFAAAFFRGIVGVRRGIVALMILVPALCALFSFFVFDQFFELKVTFGAVGIRPFVAAIGTVVASVCFGAPIGGAYTGRKPRTLGWHYSLVLLNAFFAIIVGIALILLNWATS